MCVYIPITYIPITETAFKTLKPCLIYTAVWTEEVIILTPSMAHSMQDTTLQHSVWDLQRSWGISGKASAPLVEFLCLCQHLPLHFHAISPLSPSYIFCSLSYFSSLFCSEAQYHFRFIFNEGWLPLSSKRYEECSVFVSLLLPSYSYKYSQLCMPLTLTEIFLKCSNASYILNYQYSTHFLLKAKMFPIMILIPTRDMQQLECISINPKEKGSWWEGM